MRLLLFNRKKYPTAFSIERLFEQLTEGFRSRGVEVSNIDLPHYNNKIDKLVKNIRWARSRVQEQGEKSKVIKHITGDVTSIILGFSGPTVMTIHDCNPLLRYPKTHPRYWFYRWLIYELPSKKADAVTVISEKTKHEVLKLTNCLAEKIHVIPNFIDPVFTSEPRDFASDKPVILQVGVKENKNIGRLAEALKGISCRLEIIGRPSEADQALLDRNNIEYNWATGISDEEVRALYANCDLLCFVSTYEGFGLPILEAQKTGRPVITSNLSPHREVAGAGGAVLVDPYDVDQIRKAIVSVIQDSSLRDQLTANGSTNVANYDMMNVVDKYIALYNSIS